MTAPAGPEVLARMEASWPAAALRQLGPVRLRQGLGGGNRVSAATAEGPVAEADVAAAEAAMRDWGQVPQWMIGPGQDRLDAVLAGRGYRVHEPVWLYLAPVALLAQEPPPVSALALWPPLAIQREIWAAGGIGPARVAVMERAPGPKTALLARSDDRAAGAGFVALERDIAYLHALTVLPQLRRRGAARHMMQRAAVWAQAEGAAWLALAVTRANDAANRLYASLGMAVVEQYHYRILDGGGP